MRSVDAEKLANELIRKHLCGRGTETVTGYPGLCLWSFKWSRALGSFGQCNLNDHTISLSLELTVSNSEEEVKNTILHEIAHALAGRGHNHDNYWKSICISIGAKPERCFDDTEKSNLPGREYEAHCSCGYKHLKIRKPRRALICRYCREKLQWQRIGIRSTVA